MAAVLKKRALAEYSANNSNSISAAQAASSIIVKSEHKVADALNLNLLNKPSAASTVAGGASSSADSSSLLALKAEVKLEQIGQAAQDTNEPSPEQQRLLAKKAKQGRFKDNQDGHQASYLCKTSLAEQIDFIINSQYIYGSDLAELLQLFRRCLDDKIHCRQIGCLLQQLLITIRDHEDEFERTACVGVLKELISWTGYPQLDQHLTGVKLLNEIVGLAQITDDKLVVAELLSLIEKLSMKHQSLPGSVNHQQHIEFQANIPNLISMAKKLLSQSRSHLIKRKCLELLGLLAPVPPADSSSIDHMSKQSECLAIIKILRDYSNYFDSRVRSSALSAILKLHERGVRPDISLYCEFCEALKDDYEGCRVMAIRLLDVISHHYSDCLVCLDKGDEQIRMIDDAFAKICSMINDLSVPVRTQAVSILGNFRNVSPDFLEQTLDKKLMSNLRLKKSAHERNRESCMAGEWATGRKWASDAPQGDIAPETITLMNIGACGAFIHGLEDEFSVVRMASLESLVRLAEHSPKFAKQSLDFLVDMFNDEIEDIRLKAIFCLGRIARKDLCLRDDQIEVILPVLKDSSLRTRESLHTMLGMCRIASQQSLKSCIDNLLENLRRYPEDKDSIWQCFQHLGTNHADFTNGLVYDLLGVHNYFDLQEPSLDDNAYISVLILIVNAASINSKIIPVFEKYKIFSKHYLYLRDFVPDLVPFIKKLDKDWNVKNDSLLDKDAAFDTFLMDVFNRIENSITSSSSDLKSQTSVIELSINDLKKYASIERSLSSAADFAKLYLECQIHFRSIMSNPNWINAFLLPALQSSSLRNSLYQILHTTFRLIHQFYGWHPLQLSLVLQIRVKALALQLIAVIHGSNASALTLCEAFLEEVFYLKKHTEKFKLTCDILTTKMLKEITNLHEPKPGSVARVLKPLFQSSSNLSETRDITKLFTPSLFKNPEFEIKKSYAVIEEPKERTETPINFTSGLILTLKFDAKLYNIKDIKNVRIKVHFADKQNHLLLPRLSDFHLLDYSCLKDPGSSLADSSKPNQVCNYRLQTNAYLSHGVWSEACFVELSLVLDFRETLSTSLSVSQTWSLKSNVGFKLRSEESMMVELCKPVRILIAPKPHKR